MPRKEQPGLHGRAPAELVVPAVPIGRTVKASDVGVATVVVQRPDLCKGVGKGGHVSCDKWRRAQPIHHRPCHTHLARGPERAPGRPQPTPSEIPQQGLGGKLTTAREAGVYRPSSSDPLGTSRPHTTEAPEIAAAAVMAVRRPNPSAPMPAAHTLTSRCDLVMALGWGGRGFPARRRAGSFVRTEANYG